MRLIEGACGDSATMSSGFSSDLVYGAPIGTADEAGPGFETWTGILPVLTGSFKVCWCPRMDNGCDEAADFSTSIGILTVSGPRAGLLTDADGNATRVMAGEIFSLTLA